MIITFPKCPSKIIDSLLNIAESALIPFMLKSADIKWGESGAHGVYYLPAIDLIQQKKLLNATMVAWRMVHVIGNRSLAAEVDLTNQSDNTEVTSLNEGVFSSEPNIQLEYLRQSKKRGSFELRLLRIPEVYLMAIWLHSSKSDVVIPLNPAPIGLIAGNKYSVTNLVSVLSYLVNKISSNNI